jgi:hypothetical protein
MGKGLDLETVIRGLHRSEIRVGFQTFSGGIVIWISDRSTRVRAERVFDDASPMTIADTAVEWMHSTALRKFPDSNYAIQHRRETAPILPAVVRPAELKRGKRPFRISGKPSVGHLALAFTTPIQICQHLADAAGLLQIL